MSIVTHNSITGASNKCQVMRVRGFVDLTPFLASAKCHSRYSVAVVTSRWVERIGELDSLYVFCPD